jgi:predicted GTPase
MGYGPEQIHDLQKTIERTPCDSVIIGTPIDLSRVVKIKLPHTRVHYELQELGAPTLRDALKDLIKLDR